jgi:dynein heavy chain
VEDAVKELNSKLKNLTDDYDRAIQEKDRALEEAKRCTNRLNLATRLVTALGSENIRWAKSIELLN